MVPPIMEGSKKKMNTVISLSNELINVAEFTIVTEFIATVKLSKIPAAAAMLNVESKKIIPLYI